MSDTHQLPWDYILKFIIVGEASVGKTSILCRLTEERFLDFPTPTVGVDFGSKILEVGDGKRVKIQCWDTAGSETFRSLTRSYFRGSAGCLLVFDVMKPKTFESATSWLADLRSHAEPNVAIILVANKTDLCSEEPPTPSPSVPASPATEIIPDPPEYLDSAFSPPPSGPPSPKISPQLDFESSPALSSPPSAPPTPTPPPIPTSLLPKRLVSRAEAQEFAEKEGLLYVETSAKEGWGVEEAFERTAREVLVRMEREREEAGGKKGKKKDIVRIGDRAGAVAGGCC